jgi:hypothetical protein
MNRIGAKVLALALAATAAGCGITDLDINRDPNRATDVAPDQLFPTALLNIASTRTIEIGPATTLISQIWASNGSAGVFSSPERFVISPFTAGNTWRTLYPDAGRNLTLMKNQALAGTPARPNVAAQADIMLAYSIFIATQLWERVPFTQALDGQTFPTPEFDPQDVVLRGIVAKLDSAVARIDAAGQPGVVSGDFVYGGNMESWRRLANTLKLRTLMLIRNKDTTVDAQINAVLGQPLIREVNQEAAFPFFATTGAQNNAWRLNNLFGGFVDDGNYFLFAGATIVDLMNGLNDPRLNTYFALPVNNLLIPTNGGGKAGTTHVGQAAGAAQWNTRPISMVSQNIFRQDFPNRIATSAEVWLFEAEFRALQGNLAASHTAYIAGVQRALNWFDGKPGAITAAAKTAYINSLPQSFTSQTQALQAIWAQQYIEVFDRSPDNWTQWRRTKYPTLSLPSQAQLGDIIRRFPYPSDEKAANPNTPVDPPLDRPMWFEK